MGAIGRPRQATHAIAMALQLGRNPARFELPYDHRRLMAPLADSKVLAVFGEGDLDATGRWWLAHENKRPRDCGSAWVKRLSEAERLWFGVGEAAA